MPDPLFSEPRLAELYDLLEPSRPDLEPYRAMVAEFGARSVLDIGCGTGTFACLLARNGIDVTGVDPAAASLAVAARKPFADRVSWIHRDAAAMPALQLELATMTGNVAQVFLADDDWTHTLGAVWAALRPGGRLLFEVRDPARKAWRTWNRARSYRRVLLPEAGTVETWVDLIEVDLPFVSFRHTFVFASDGAVLTSDSTLRFRNQAEMDESLQRVGFVVDEVRDAPDRPGLEHVYIARRGEGRSCERV